MSLLDEALDEYIIVNTLIVDDGLGSIITTYSDGARIKGAMRFDVSQEARTGQALGVTSTYTFITTKNINLQYHNIIRRLSDGKVFRITSDGDDSFTPKSANLDMRLVTCEEWSIPS